MNKKFIITVALASAFMMSPFVGIYKGQAYAQTRTESIAAVVNNEAITATDLDERLRLLMISSGIPDSKETRERLKPQVLNMLIDEQLMLQEAKRLNMSVSEEEVKGGFAKLAEQNGMQPEQFREVVRKSGVPTRAMDRQIKSQIAWGRVVQQRIRPTVTVNDLEVDSMLDRLRRNIGKEEYLVGEIFLPIDTPTEEGQVSQLAQKLTRELVQGKVPFPRVAAQFSQSASSKRGGDMGWVEGDQLPEEIVEVLSRMNEGDLSEPIKTLAGYYIVTLRKKRTITEESIPSRDEMMFRIGNERLERAQRSHLLNLKSSAFIERRV